MLQELLNEKDFSVMMRKHVKDLVEFLLHKGMHFSILTNVNEIEFEPPLPDEIKSSFKPITMFVLAGYTFESCTIDEHELCFEAGFGPNNFGSFVSVPLLSILQIIMDETPVMINLAIEHSVGSKSQKGGVKKSMDALLSNPENEKLLKK